VQERGKTGFDQTSSSSDAEAVRICEGRPVDKQCADSLSYQDEVTTRLARNIHVELIAAASPARQRASLQIARPH